MTSRVLTRDFTYVGDIVRATRAAAGAPAAAGQAYNVGGGSRVSVRDALELLEAFAGRPLDVAFEDGQRGDVRHTGADTTNARRDLGFVPGTPFEQGLRAEFEWMTALPGRGGRRPRARTPMPARAASRAPRFLFHSNEIVGLGHLRPASASSARPARPLPNGGTSRPATTCWPISSARAWTRSSRRPGTAAPATRARAWSSSGSRRSPARRAPAASTSTASPRCL